MSKYFKKPSGVVVEYDEKNHDLKSFRDRFQECNADGSKIEPKAKVKKDDK